MVTVSKSTSQAREQKENQMHRRLIGGLLGGLLLSACGQGDPGGKTDVYVGNRPDTVPSVPVDAAAGDDDAPAAPNAGCDEDAMTVNGCIINPPGPAQGGGTPVARQNPKTCTP